MRIITFFLGSVAIGAVIWLGYQTTINQSPQLVALFGIASAVVAPLGFTLIGYTLQSKNQEVIKQLAKVSDIERLINEAESQEEKIRLLKQQKDQLTDIVIFEVRKQTLIARKANLENEGIRVLDELQAIGEELDSMFNAQANVDESVKLELEQLHQRVKARQRGDVIFSLGGRNLILEADIIRNLPWGILLYEILCMIQSRKDFIKNLRKSTVLYKKSKKI